MKFKPTQPQTDIDKKIMYAQSWNLAAQVMSNNKDTKSIEFEEELDEWQEYFYDKLMQPYAELENQKSVEMEKKDQARQEAEMSAHENI